MVSVAAREHHEPLGAAAPRRATGRSAADRHPARRFREFVAHSSRLVLMQRHACNPRNDWRTKVEEVGLTFHSHEDGPYWDESACYELTAKEVNALESAANALHHLCIEAAEVVIEREWWTRLGIPAVAVPG